MTGKTEFALHLSILNCVKANTGLWRQILTFGHLVISAIHSLRCQFRSAFDRPLFALEEGDLSQRNAFEKRGEILDADFTLNNRAGSQRMFDAFQPAVCHGLKARLGIIRQGQAADLSLGFLEPAVSQFAILGLQRAPKLLNCCRGDFLTVGASFGLHAGGESATITVR